MTSPSKKGPRRILGIDPGLAIVGFGCIDVTGSNFRPVEYGVLRTEAGLPLPERLRLIYEQMQLLIGRLAPDQSAIEELFFGKNATTGMAVSHARGVLLLALAEAGIPISEYTPVRVKQTVAGDGRADKAAMQTMVARLLGLPEIPRPDDAADGLALAICHAQHGPLAAALARAKK